MHFGNNIEKYGFEKSSWPIIEINDLPDGGQEIYMAKSRISDPSINAPVWLVRKVTIRTRGTVTTITTEQTEGWDNIWDDGNSGVPTHKTLEYHLI